MRRTLRPESKNETVDYEDCEGYRDIRASSPIVQPNKRQTRHLKKNMQSKENFITALTETAKRSKVKDFVCHERTDPKHDYVIE